MPCPSFFFCPSFFPSLSVILPAPDRPFLSKLLCYFPLSSHREPRMKFAKIIFWIAGVWGFLVITPLYFMFDLIGKNDPPPITHPGFFYGFVGLALVWQITFIFIARNPVRF